MNDDGKVLPGGGAVETHIAEELKAYPESFPAEKQVAIELIAML